MILMKKTYSLKCSLLVARVLEYFGKVSTCTVCNLPHVPSVQIVLRSFF